ncbi:MAG: amino acid ABC transporter substrate-binding protein [Chloroflexi bacterium]|nr:amino acid ABC transporter substrate-binding protein [Chloroflexota bacterium]MBI3732278.1 amino acid ABC transporter substrate-binding protein [Chloroflexota bacterium]
MFKKFVVLIVLALALIAVGCGPTAPATSAPTTAPAAQAAPTATKAAAPAAPTFAGTITFGAAVSLTGKTNNEGKYTKDGYDLAVEAVNAAGGIKVGGKAYQIAIKFYDDESNPDTSAKLTEKLITEDKVNLLLGPYGSGPTRNATVISEKYKVPMVEANGAAEDIFSRGFKYSFGILSPGKMYLRGVLEMALALDPNLKTVAILVENEIFSLEVADGAKAYAESKGLKVVYNEKYPSATKDVSSLLTVVKGLNPDIILGAGHLQDSILIVKQGKDLGVNAKVWAFSVGPATPEFRDSLKKDADYIFTGAQWTPALKLTGNDVFKTPENYAKVFTQKYGYEPPYQAAESSAAVITYQKAIEKADSIEPEKVRAALVNLEFTSFYGLIKFDDRGINVYKAMAVEQLQTDGKKRTVFPADVAEAKPQFPVPAWDKR